MKTRILAITIVSLVFGASSAFACSGCGCAAQTAATSSEKHHAELTDIVHTAQHAGQFKTLVTALQAADLVDALQAPGPYTVFAPTDKAFAALPKGTLESLLKAENKAKLQAILKYHVVPGKVMSSDLMKYTNAKTLHGNKVDLTLRINDARVIKADIKTTNGVIHVIDRVILPSNAKPIAGYDTNKAPAQVDKTIVETAVESGQFNTLVTALQAAGLADALSGDGPFTVFAPTDAAFAKLPDGTVESLVQPENKAKLQAILKYHVIPAQLGSHDIVAAHTVKTLNGKPIYPSLQVDQAGLEIKNIYCRNGVIHVIDTVILPEETS
ncbi:MAG: fasciclin domain-containing protein [Phycisphaerales bacterium]|nr:MAG: fasciclin domain-containing protein [Phycisphaerales bacterium]